ncbi:MAG: c-type cytochrome [Bacteroidetes bacterium]|nr:c-type cytochrome [Bacteroidota bacterium]
MKFSSPVFCIAILVLFFVAACNNHNKAPGSAAVEAKDALSTFQVADGFKIEMIASEPLVTSPVDMEIDEYGRLFVVEMPGYPLDKSGSGKIIQLTDTNGDGNMDKRTVFKQGLLLPTSIMRWKKGFLVTDSPNLLYLEDTDGDGQANICDTIVTGFALTNPQHNMNNPVYGLDNWIYIANQGSVATTAYKDEFGDEGSEIVFYGQSGTPKLPKNANGRSVRVQPDNKKMEMLSSDCQFGQTFDEWGHLFGCNNSNQGYQEVIANRYFDRNPDLIISDATQDMSDHLNACEVFPTTTNPDRQILTNVGVMTSACGLTAYLGNSFPSPYNGKITFVAEPVSNLVHVDVLKDSGASFIASRILQHKEFLSSTDAWARPVNMYVGPDGALYVLDYYRRVIESPEWMSEEAIKAGNLYDGIDKGRIFRISAKDAKLVEWTKGLKLGDETNEELVNTLANPNAWWRMNAQRLLVDRADKNSVPALTAMAKGPSVMGRLHALWALEGIKQLQPQLIEQALKDSEAGIRENAIQLAEFHLNASPSLVNSLLALHNDKNAKVRFQLLLTLGYIHSPQAAEVRNKILFSDINDKWVQIAALSASSSQTASLLKVVLNKFRDDIPAYASLVQRLSAMTAIGGKEEDIHHLLNEAVIRNGKQSIKYAALLQGLEQGLKSRKSTLAISPDDQRKLVQSFFQNPSKEMRKAAFQLLKLNGISDSSFRRLSVMQAAAIISDTTRQPEIRAEAVRFLSFGDISHYSNDIKKLITTKEEFSVQLAALQTLGMVNGTAIGDFILEKWPLLSPSIREATIGIFMADSSRIPLLIDALETNKINPNYVSFPTSVQLMQNDNESLRNRSRALFTKNKREAERINKEYQKALQLNGDTVKGKDVFVQNCAICHQVRGKVGIAFGPDLGTIHNWIKEDIMAAVLDPGLSISSGFDLWSVELNNGETLQGIIASETSAAITLRSSSSVAKTINRQDIKSIKSLNASLMPTGFEKKINQQQMADLLAFLRKN